MSAGIDRIDPEPATTILVRAEGRPFHCVVVRPIADAHGGRVIGTPAQGHTLPGNVCHRHLNLYYIIMAFHVPNSLSE